MSLFNGHANEMKQSKKRASRVEVVMISDLLKANIIKCEGGLFRYSNGMSDEAIAKRIRDDMPSGTVGDIRRELYGRMYDKHPESTTPKKATKQDIMEVLKRIDERLERLEAAFK